MCKKQKIGILTYHTALNYGAILQAYALISYLNQNFDKIEVEVIDYRSKFLDYTYSYQKIFNVDKKLFFPKSILLYKKKKIFNNFILNNIKLSQNQYNIKNINDATEIYDKVIVGSDQVWNININGGDLTYFLSFLSKRKRYSYAASIGIDTVKIFENLKIKNELLNFSAISLREPSNLNIFDQEIRTNICDVNIDPCLLLDRISWEKIIKNHYHGGKYVLVYMIKYSSNLLVRAKEIARKEKCKVICIGNFHGITGVKYKSNIDVSSFISLFSNADYILANSFHGTVFSILFHKNFLVEMSHNDGRNLRLEDLLQLFGLRSRVLNRKAIDSMYNAINWNYIDKKLDEERIKSKQYLRHVIYDNC
ncbi:MAG: polysaccharide pyruvyl transferase family protein [Sphaerochaetaceae bacterium]|nr:polysaccharide pyruvyl transferase family protein [Sphaerochaetaceae bacterium]